MILTVTLNPLLELRLNYSSIQFGKEHRKPIQKFSVGGKGINVSRQLKYFNSNSLAFTFLGGNNGKLITNLLEKENINFTSVRIEDEIRTATVVFDNKKKLATTFFSNDFIVNENEAEEFKIKLEKIIRNCEVVIFSGSSPCSTTDSIFPFGIKIANQYDKISVVDTYGSHLSDCLDASPTILHNNISEIESSLNLKLKSEDDKINFLNYLYLKNIKQSYLTDGANETFASNFDFHFKIANPKIKQIDSTGSGDAFVSGIVHSLINDWTFEQSLAFATATAVTNAMNYNVCCATLAEVEKIKSQIVVNTIGKKIRLVDATPTI